jgi:Ca2+-binding EF-hand superfamily protein
LTGWRRWPAAPLVIVALAAPVLGCGRSAQLPEPEAETAAAEAQVEEAQAEGARAQAGQQQTPAAVGTEEETAAAHEPVAPAVRFMLFTPQGPMVCDLAVMVAGEASAASLDHLVDEAMTTAESLVDGAPTWNKLVESREFRYGQFGNAPTKNDEERRQAITRYDWNRNGRVERDEMRRFLTRNQRSDNSLPLRSYDTSPGPTAAVALWQLFDTDGDNVLSADEMSAAPARLRTRDAGDSELVLMSEVAARPDPMQNNYGASGPAPQTIAYVLDADTDWKRVLASLAGQIENGIPRAPELFRELDANRSDSLSREELGALTKCPPDLAIAAHFAEGEAASNPEPPLVVTPRGQADKWKHVAQLAGRAYLEAPGLALEFSLNDRAAAPEGASEAAEAQFSRLDQDGNAYLDRDEARAVEASLAAFDGLDANEDDRVDLDELRALLARNQAASAAQVQIIVSRDSDLVFVALDENHDGRLGAREIARSGQRLASLDTDGDGRLAPAEVPDRIAIQVMRGAPASEGMAMTADYAPAQPGTRSGPVWFQRMDTNGDGDVSRGEFLGTAERFAELDADHDGFISAAEAEQAERNTAQAAVRPCCLRPQLSQSATR